MELVKCSRQLKETTPALAAAFTRLDDSYRRLQAGDRLIDYWVALEALFLTKDEKSELLYRISLKIARYIGGTIDDRNDLVKFIKRSYGFRSRVVHGGRLGTKELLDLEAVDAETGNVLRNALRKSLSARRPQCCVDR